MSNYLEIGGDLRPNSNPEYQEVLGEFKNQLWRMYDSQNRSSMDSAYFQGQPFCFDEDQEWRVWRGLSVPISISRHSAELPHMGYNFPFSKEVGIFTCLALLGYAGIEITSIAVLSGGYGSKLSHILRYKVIQLEGTNWLLNSNRSFIETEGWEKSLNSEPASIRRAINLTKTWEPISVV